ncbi:peptide ABC transporter ATPase [miscellaneous Crenarchaeota group archaeon SMTZ1-55]|nr:MAG: peptide ABC transporter ATPase [miscellaneous Crenarchaeota group archaeon SMTZ1-55]
MTALLHLEDIRTYYFVRKGLFGSVPLKAVDGVSLDIDAGETVAIVGESGSGKTTLGRTAIRLLKPVSGKIVFEGEDVTNSDANLKTFRRRAQIIFQDPFTSLNPHMTVEEIINEPMIIHHIDEAEKEIRRSKALRDVRLLPPDEFLPKYPHMLSGGQRQRVGIARSLVLEPVFMVADEPVSMIDASSRVEILLLLGELQKKYGMGIMYITHDIATAKYFTQRIGVMYAGKIVEAGPTSTVLNHPLHPYTVALKEAVPDPDPNNRLRFRNVIPGEPPNPIAPPAGCRFHPRCPHATDKCGGEEPALREIARRRVACHYAETFLAN